MRASADPAVAATIVATTAIGEHYHAAAATVGLSVQEARLLFVLVDRPTNMLGLTAALRVPKSTMTGLMAGLEARSLVVRQPDARDRRHLVATPTAEGGAVAARFAGALAAAVRPALDLLTGAERDEVGALAGLVLVALEREGDAPVRRSGSARPDPAASP